jgi:hypothetical protein
MAGSRKTWISILIAAVIVVGMLALAVVGGTAFFIYRHVNTQYASERSAGDEFAAARARFAGQQPLIELRHNEEPILHRDTGRGARPPSTRKLESLRVLAYDEDEEKLVRVTIPFWLLRMVPSKNLSFLHDEGIDFDTSRVRLTLEDVERRGPGLILDQKDRRGSRVLVWTE